MTDPFAPAPKKLLTRYLEATGTHGFQKLASMIESSKRFANQMVTAYGPEEWLDLPLPMEKEAARTEPGSLVLHTGKFNPHAGVSTDEQFGRGYSFQDTRKNRAEVYEDREDIGSEITETGIYKVISAIGEWKELIVVPFCGYLNLVTSNKCAPGYSTEGHVATEDLKLLSPKTSLRESGYNLKPQGSKGNPMFMLIDPKTGESCSHGGSLFGTPVEKEDISKYFLAPEKIKKGETYLVSEFGKKGELLEVTKVKKDDNLVHVTFLDGGWISSYEKDDPDTTVVTFNTTLTQGDPDLNILSSKALIVKLKAEREERDHSDVIVRTVDLDFKPGSLTTLQDFLCGHQIKKAAVTRIDENRFRLRMGNHSTFEMSKVATAVLLADRLGIYGPEAQTLVEEADTAGQKRFLIKESRVTVENVPLLGTTQMNNDFGVREDQPESYILSTDNSSGGTTAPRVGDKVQNGFQMTVQTGSPEELYELSQELSEPNMFDLGVVSSLVNTFDGADAVEKFLPDLRKGLDRMGRTLFLMYWKPEDFVESYGSEDISDIENRLTSAFKQQGELILELMQSFKFEDKVDMNSLSK